MRDRIQVLTPKPLAFLRCSGYTDIAEQVWTIPVHDVRAGPEEKVIRCKPPDGDGNAGSTHGFGRAGPPGGSRKAKPPCSDGQAKTSPASETIRRWSCA